MSKLTLAIALVVPLALCEIAVGCSKPKAYPTTSNLDPCCGSLKPCDHTAICPAPLEDGNVPIGYGTVDDGSCDSTSTKACPNSKTEPIYGQGIERLKHSAEARGRKWRVIFHSDGYYCGEILHKNSTLIEFIDCTKDGPNEAASRTVDKIEHPVVDKVIAGEPE